MGSVRRGWNQFARCSAAILAPLGASLVLASCAQGAAEISLDGSLVSAADAGDDVTVRHDGAASDATGSPEATVIGIGDGSQGGEASTDASNGTDASPDTGSGPTPDAGADAAPPLADSGMTCPPGTAGPTCAQCASGFHACGATCTADAPNNPSTGCAHSCGTGACPAPGGEVASCSAAGDCTTACGAGTKMCSGSTTCSACCTDSDCPANVGCNAGTCSVCLNASYGTCSAPCDTDLTTDSNCGSCGNSCSTNSLQCLFGFGGCGCQGSGPPSNWSCN